MISIRSKYIRKPFFYIVISVGRFVLRWDHYSRDHFSCQVPLSCNGSWVGMVLEGVDHFSFFFRMDLPLVSLSQISALVKGVLFIYLYTPYIVFLLCIVVFVHGHIAVIFYSSFVIIFQ